MEIIAGIFITSYVMKFVVAALDTPFVYLATKVRKDADGREIVKYA